MEVGGAAPLWTLRAGGALVDLRVQLGRTLKVDAVEDLQRNGRETQRDRDSGGKSET